MKNCITDQLSSCRSRKKNKHFHNSYVEKPLLLLLLLLLPLLLVVIIISNGIILSRAPSCPLEVFDISVLALTLPHVII